VQGLRRTILWKLTFIFSPYCNNFTRFQTLNKGLIWCIVLEDDYKPDIYFELKFYHLLSKYFPSVRIFKLWLLLSSPCYASHFPISIFTYVFLGYNQLYLFHDRKVIHTSTWLCNHSLIVYSFFPLPLFVHSDELWCLRILFVS
jgi:hypothetical protein